MKNTLYFYVYIFLSVLLVFLTISNALPFANGAPEGRSGGPANMSLTCGDPMLACHNPSVIFIDGLIKTNIGEYGYLPDSVYTIIASIEHEKHNIFGFQLSPENSLGQFIGSLINIDDETQLKMDGNYITHTIFGIQAEDNTKSWIFKWQAPKAGKGEVTFYAAFNAANGDGTAFGDFIFTSNITFNEKVNIDDTFNIFPKPAGNYIHIETNGLKCQNLEIELINSNGKIVMRKNKKLKDRITLYIEKLNPGIYILIIDHCGNRYMDKVLVIRI